MTECKRRELDSLYSVIREDTMDTVRQRLKFKGFVSVGLLDDFDTVLKDFRCKVLKHADYGNIEYGPAHHEYSSILNSIILHVEELLSVPMIRWYHTTNKRLQIASYRSILTNLKFEIEKMETLHHTFVPNSKGSKSHGCT